MNQWFTADTHFGDKKIIHLAHRPFKNVDTMDRILIQNWNARVKPEDIVYHIGDFCYRGVSKYSKYLEKLNGTIIVIKGNHDRNNGVKTILESATIKHGGHRLYLVHRPFNCNPNIKINLVGHVHKNWKFRVKRCGLFKKVILINVGVDVHNFRPVNINELLSEYSKWNALRRK